MFESLGLDEAKEEETRRVTALFNSDEVKLASLKPNEFEGDEVSERNVEFIMLLFDND